MEDSRDWPSMKDRGSQPMKQNSETWVPVPPLPPATTLSYENHLWTLSNHSWEKGEWVIIYVSICLYLYKEEYIKPKWESNEILGMEGGAVFSPLNTAKNQIPKSQAYQVSHIFDSKEGFLQDE